MDASLVPESIGDHSPSLSGRVLIERYRLGDRLGRGELGDVYAADDLLRLSIADEAAVAVKVFHGDLVSGCGGVRPMAPALAAACRLSHPHAINAYDFYQDGETLFLAMERLGGVTLAERLDESRGGPPLNVTEADANLRKFVDALVHIHAKTTTPLLRLNPQRIRLAEEDRQLCVADLGLSDLIDQTLLCQSAMTAGTAAYLAPEVMAASETETPDCRADQFSLGALAMALFTGSPRGSTDGLHKALDRTEAAIWIDLLPRLLAENPDDRFDDLAGLQEILLSSSSARRRSGSKWRRRTAVSGADRNVARDDNRSGWRFTNPLVPTASAAIGLGLAFAAWAFGPDLLFKERWKGKATTQIDEARRDLHEMDALRIDLLAKGLNRETFDASVRRLAKAKPDYALVDALGKASAELENGENDSAQVRLSSVNASLSERMEQFSNAVAAIDACDRLMQLRKTLDALDGLMSLAGDASANRIGEAWQQAADAFGGGDFQASATVAAAAASRVEDALGAALRERRTEANAARDTWRAVLRSIGDFPEIEPIGEPGRQIDAGDTAVDSGDRVEAARRFTAARDRYRSWAEELTESVAEGNHVKGGDPSASGGTEGSAAVPAASTNSIGMKFVPVRGLMASIWETRLIDYLAFTHDTGVDAGYLWRDFAATGTSWRGADDENGPEDLADMWGDFSVTPIQGPCHPVTSVSSYDAQRFCEWLTRREHQSGRIRADQVYRLPSDLEWSRLAGLDDDPDKTPHERSFDYPSHFPWGTEPVRRASSGNYATWPNRENRGDLVAEQDSFEYTAPAGSFAPNGYGIFDLGGNVWERTSDSRYGQARGSSVIRGGGWKSFHLDTMRTACRDSLSPPNKEVGFRIVLAPEKGSDSSESETEQVADPNDGN